MAPRLLLDQLLRKGVLASHEGQLDAARANFAEVLQRVPEHAVALRLMAELAHGQGDLGAAEDFLKRSLKSEAADPQSWFRLGSVIEDQLRWSDAEACFARACELSPQFAQAHYNRARMLRHLGQPALATQAVAQALLYAPRALAVQSLQLRALLEDESGLLHVALTTLEHAIGLAPDRAALHHNRGVLLQRLARPAEALAAHDLALKLGLDASDAHYNRGNSLQSLGLTQQALDAYGTALQRDPQHALALFDLARLRWRLGQANFTAAVEAAAAAAPRSPLAWGILGRLWLAAGDADRATAAFSRAIELSSDSAGYLDGLGQSLSRLGRHPEALLAHQRAVELSPQQVTVQAHLASCLLQLGQTSSAAQVAELAVRLDPGDQHAWALLGLAWRALGHDANRWLNDYQAHIQVDDLAPPPGWANMASFNLALSTVLQQWHTDAQAPIDQTLRHGSQTMGNLFDQTHPLLDQLKRLIAQAVDRYIARLRQFTDDETHPLLGRVSATWRFTDSWSSRLRDGGFHTNHVHSHGWISSCYYVALPPAITQGGAALAPQAGWIRFGEPDIVVPGCDFTPGRVVHPRVGRLVLFPSFMWHGTAPFSDTQERLTVAFDVMPSG